MKKLFPFITFTFLVLFFGCKKDTEVGRGYTFMEKLSATLPAQGGEEVLSADNVFFKIDFLASIQAGDTLKQSFPDFNAGEQTISGSWFTIETIGNGENTLPKEVKVTTQTNTTGAERQLIFSVWNGECGNLVTITQSQN